MTFTYYHDTFGFKSVGTPTVEILFLFRMPTFLYLSVSNPFLLRTTVSVCNFVYDWVAEVLLTLKARHSFITK